MNPRLDLLQPYPFEKLRKLFSAVTPNTDLRLINLSIGEPKHPTPQFIRDALRANLDGLASYPQTAGRMSLRTAIADWLKRRYGIGHIDPATQIIPTLGSREALFALAQTVLDGDAHDALVICPNPFYQIYEGAALLAGAKPHFINTTAANGWRMNWSAVPAELWRRVRLVFTCSPGNPSGGVMTLEEWRELFALSDRHGFIIAADECYTEIYFDESKPPLGALEAADKLGRDAYSRLVVLGSLSKRSNVPGKRSGFAAGDAELFANFKLYRTYHGSAMSPAVQAASEAAWADEAHVRENRRLYQAKFAAFYDIVNPLLPLARPQASFYYWVKTPFDDQDFAVRLLRDTNVSVLPGSYLGRAVAGINPGANHVRIALVSTLEESAEAARRIANLIKTL
jgi:N-succinyldiaminopimelate aminotransferase